jgi:hypothetical protein
LDGELSDILSLIYGNFCAELDVYLTKLWCSAQERSNHRCEGNDYTFKEVIVGAEII